MTSTTGKSIAARRTMTPDPVLVRILADMVEQAIRSDERERKAA